MTKDRVTGRDGKTYPRRYATAEEREQRAKMVVALYEGGFSVRFIAAHLGVSVGMVHRIIARSREED